MMPIHPIDCPCCRPPRPTRLRRALRFAGLSIAIAIGLVPLAIFALVRAMDRAR